MILLGRSMSVVELVEEIFAPYSLKVISFSSGLVFFYGKRMTEFQSNQLITTKEFQDTC